MAWPFSCDSPIAYSLLLQHLISLFFPQQLIQAIHTMVWNQWFWIPNETHWIFSFDFSSSNSIEKYSFFTRNLELCFQSLKTEFIEKRGNEFGLFFRFGSVTLGFRMKREQVSVNFSSEFFFYLKLGEMLELRPARGQHGAEECGQAGGQRQRGRHGEDCRRPPSMPDWRAHSRNL